MNWLVCQVYKNHVMFLVIITRSCAWLLNSITVYVNYGKTAGLTLKFCQTISVGKHLDTWWDVKDIFCNWDISYLQTEISEGLQIGKNLCFSVSKYFYACKMFWLMDMHLVASEGSRAMTWIDNFFFFFLDLGSWKEFYPWGSLSCWV